MKEYNIQIIGELVDEILAELRPVSIPLTRKQAAAYCNVDGHTIDNWDKVGKIKKVKRGSLVGYLVADLDKYKKA